MMQWPEPFFRRCAHRLLQWSLGIPIVFLSLQGIALAAETAEKLVNVADTRALSPSISKWIADVYNISYVSFALLVLVTMTGMGLVLGLLCDRLVGMLGLNLGKMEHHE
jgi:hypothetical protein